MTNTLTKIADLKEEIECKEQRVKLSFNKALEHRPHNPVLKGKYNELVEWSHFNTFKEDFDKLKEMLVKRDKLEARLKLSLVEDGGNEND